MAIAYLGFVSLGLTDGMLGVAWPSLRGDFELPLDAVGALLVSGTVGYLLASAYSGRTIALLGVGKLLLAGSVLRGVGLLGYGLSPAWWVVVLLGLAVGVGSGCVDAGLNTYFAANHGANLMNWLHACFGLGATLGPLVMTAVLEAGQSWRWGYVAVGLAHGALGLCFALTSSRWRLGERVHPAAAAPPERRIGGLQTLKLPLVWLGIVLFAIYTGTENVAGQWAYSLFTEARSVAPDTAGLWVSVYWGCLMAGRIFFGFLAHRFRADRLLRAVMLGVIVGAALIWSNLTQGLSFVGVALMGFAEAPIFPLLVTTTQERVGAEHAPNAIGFQVASGGMGFALLPALAGVLARSVGLEAIGLFLCAISTAMFLLHEVTARRARRALRERANGL